MAPYAAQPTLSSRAIWPMLRAAEARGARIDSVLSGLADPQQIWGDDVRIPHGTATAIGVRCIAATGTSDVLLRADEHIEPGDFDVLAYAGRSSATVADSIIVSDRYIRLMHDAVRTELTTTPEYGVWRFEVSTNEPEDIGTSAYLMALLVRGGARITGSGEHFTEVRMLAEAPDDAELYERAWGVPVRFGAGENAVIYPRAALALPLAGADSYLHGILARHAEQMLEELPPLSDLSSRVRLMLSEQLGSGDTSLSHTAKQLAMAPSTLRRHLKQEGKTHREILDELRLQTALRYLKDRRLPVSEIAFLLGFGEVSAFDKAFKRWTGKRPSELRD